jgi:hypothetical protein
MLKIQSKNTDLNKRKGAQDLHQKISLYLFAFLLLGFECTCIYGKIPNSA